jgi:hypothetical protein
MNTWSIVITVAEDHLSTAIDFIRPFAVNIELIKNEPKIEPPPLTPPLRPPISRRGTSRQKGVRRDPIDWASSQLVLKAIAEGVHDPGLLRQKLIDNGFSQNTLGPAASMLCRRGLVIQRNKQYFLVQPASNKRVLEAVI